MCGGGGGVGVKQCLFHMALVPISGAFKLSLATAIMALTLVSCYYITPFNYVGKKARDVGLTCRVHLSNIIYYAW